MLRFLKQFILTQSLQRVSLLRVLYPPARFSSSLPGPWTLCRPHTSERSSALRCSRTVSTSRALNLWLPSSSNPQPTFSVSPAGPRGAHGDKHHKPVSVSPQGLEDLGFSSLSPGLGTNPLHLLPALKYAATAAPAKSAKADAQDKRDHGRQAAAVLKGALERSWVHQGWW